MASSLPPGAPRPRLCRVRKDYPQQDYGFNLHADRSKGQYIGAVDGDSPASAAGLKTGDRIVAVNGTAVNGETHKQVVARIKEHVLECRLLVIDEAGEAWYRERKIPVPVLLFYQQHHHTPANGDNGHNHHTTSAEDDDDPDVDQRRDPDHQKRRENGGDGPIMIKINHTSDDTPLSPPLTTAAANVSIPPTKPRPRLCRLEKANSGVEFGFNLHAEKNVGHFIGNVDAGSVAQKAGLEQGQRIVGANGVLIYQNTPNRDVVEIIKRDPMKTELLVVFPEVDQWYKQNGHSFSFEDAEIVQSPASAAMKSPPPPQQQHNGKANNNSNGRSANKHQQQSVTPVQKNTNGGSRDEDDEQLYSPPAAVTIAVPPPQRGTRQDNAKSHHWSGAENGASAAAPPHCPQQQDWMNLSAAELRERVGRHKKTDPRTQQLSLLQKYEIIHNL